MTVIRKGLRVLLPAALIALSAGAAQAQSVLTPKISIGDEPRKLSPEEQERQNQLDSAYKAATSKIPDKKATNDPWASVRPDPAPAAKKKQP